MNHDGHDLGMMGMMLPAALPLWIPASAGMTGESYVIPSAARNLPPSFT